MRHMIRDNVKSIAFFYLQMILIWIMATMLFLFLRNYGVDHSASERIIAEVDPRLFLLISIFLGAMTGIVYTTVELVTERPYFLKHSYGHIILVKLIVFFIAVKLILALGISIATTVTGRLLAREEIIEILRSKSYWVFFAFFLLVAASISFVRMVSRKFGPGLLWNMFTGKYRNPREEERVFMFLDLKSSTTIAEKLGHIKFSRLIQDCFADLTPVINKHKVEIYQYVGDEAILSWHLKEGFENNNCIHCYFAYMELLKAKKDYYQKEYGVQPVFKAGVHLGNVTVAEVGLIKREIAYHGDVLNTTARIQGKCNELNQQLLISQNLLKHLLPDEQVQNHSMGEKMLKGKKQLVTIYGVTKTTQDKTSPRS